MELVDVVDSKSTAGDSVPVRVRSPAPRRSKLCIACSDLFYKSERAHAAAPPFHPANALLVCGVRRRGLWNVGIFFVNTIHYPWRSGQLIVSCPLRLFMRLCVLHTRRLPCTPPVGRLHEEVKGASLRRSVLNCFLNGNSFRNAGIFCQILPYFAANGCNSARRRCIINHHYNRGEK